MSTSPASGGLYVPQGSQQIDQMFGQTLTPMYNDVSTMNTPGYWSYPQAQSSYGNYLDPNLPQAQLAMQGAAGAANYGQGVVNQASPYAGQSLEMGFSPYYQSLIDQMGSNPFYQPAMDAAVNAQAMGAQGAQSMMSQAGNLNAYGNQIMNTGFDPQSALYNRTMQQTADQAAVSNAMAGIGSSPYGAGVTNQAMSNMNIDWQNQQLGRQAQASGAATPMYGQAAAMQTAAPQLQYQTGQMPNQVYMGQRAAELGAYGAQQNAANQGIAGYGALNQGMNQGLGVAQGLAGTSALPYNTSATLGGNSISGLSNVTNIGNQQYAPALSLANPFLQYLGVGTQAGLANAQAGQMGYNQLAGGLGGLMGFGNMMLPMMFSDRRLKEDIEPVGELDNGLTVYSYRYIGDPRFQIGLMADEVEQVHPEAVGSLAGLKFVDYGRAVV